MTLSVDNSGQGAAVTSGTTATVSLTASNDAVILVFVVSNDPTGVTLSGAGLTWTQRPALNGGSGTQFIWEFYAVNTGGAILEETVTATAEGADFSYGIVGYISILGADTTSPFDSNASIPASAASGPIAISTNASDSIIVAGFRLETGSSTSPDTDFTDAENANYQQIEYQIVSSPQTNLSLGSVTGVPDGIVADAVVQAGAGGSSAQPFGMRLIFM